MPWVKPGHDDMVSVIASEAKQSIYPSKEGKKAWIASSQGLLAMTLMGSNR